MEKLDFRRDEAKEYERRFGPTPFAKEILIEFDQSLISIATDFDAEWLKEDNSGRGTKSLEKSDERALKRAMKEP